MPLKIISPLFLALFIGMGGMGAPSYGASINADRGREIYQKRNCMMCHSIERTGGILGPDLTQVTVRRTEEWLTKWLKDPPAMLKNTDMPKIPWPSDEDVPNLIAYFKTFRKDVKKDSMGKAAKKEAGKRLMKDYDCGACHKFKDEPGRMRYPDLTREGSKRDKKWLAGWLKNPKAVKPDAYMPEFPFTDKERAAVAEYLSSLK